MSSELIQGNYPNYDLLIPTECTCKVTFSTPVMAQRLMMIDPLSTGGSGVVRYEFGKQECSIGTGVDDCGKYTLKAPVKIESGEKSRIAIQLSYMLDALKPFSLNTLELTNLSSPIKLTG